jgi:hypothetical protein
MEIVSAITPFDFNTITLADPHPLIGQAGYYFTELKTGTDKNLCLQLPECVTKQGVVTIKNAKYLDLMFERSECDELMNWIERLEYICQDIIDKKKELWFQTELTRDDIETMMTQITRLYQSGKYILMRVFIETGKTGGKCIAYNENEIGVDLDTLEANKHIIPLIMIEGVKFSSRSFEIVLKLNQVMVIGKNEKNSSCLIKRQGPILEKTTQELIINAPVQVPLAQVPVPVPVPVAQVPVPVPIAVAQVPVPVPMPVAVAQVPVPMPMPIIENNLENNNILEEVSINCDNSESISLKNPNEVYYEIYRKARDKAKEWRLKAIEAYLEVKEIKTKYMLYDMDDSTDSMEDDSDEEEEN